jgi:hypothetical protein
LSRASCSWPRSLKTLPRLEYASASRGFCLMASVEKWADLGQSGHSYQNIRLDCVNNRHLRPLTVKTSTIHGCRLSQPTSQSADRPNISTTDSRPCQLSTSQAAHRRPTISISDCRPSQPSVSQAAHHAIHQHLRPQTRPTICILGCRPSQQSASQAADHGNHQHLRL